MASRLLLTLLALLTGLSAHVAPAEARLRDVASVAVELGAQSGTAGSARAPVALARLPEPGLRNTRAFAPASSPARAVAPAAPLREVRVGIDRARE